MNDEALALQMVDISKTFGSVKANDAVSLEVRRGEILGLLGENGAGKSTMMNILYGLIPPDAGSIVIDGSPVEMTSPSVALAHGVGMVHQHFMLIPAFTVLENLVLGAEPHRQGVLDRQAARRAVREISDRFGLRVDPDALISDLGVAARQRVEILRALFRGARILVLDEPTAVLSPQETDHLFEVLKEMAQTGMSIILISHKLNELLALTDRVTIIRDGRAVGTVRTADSSASQLAALMVGRETSLTLDVPPHQRTPEPLLEVRALRIDDPRLQEVSFAVHGGEIVGLAGVDGSGQSELLDAVVGLRTAVAGKVLIGGQDATRMSSRQRLGLGLGYVPEDRTTVGLVGPLGVTENAILRRQRRPSWRRFGLLAPRALRAHATTLVERNDVRPRRIDLTAGSLSGGNQQKLLIGRELADDPRVVVVSQPTRGVDIAASRAIQRRLLQARAENRAVLVASLDLDEIKSLCDRVLVMFRGQIVGELSRASATDQELGLLMTGERS